MSKRKLTDLLEIKNPCPEDWEQMKGNDEVRFCTHCNFNVNNISMMTRKEALKLVREANGRICVRYVKNPIDNTPIFADKLHLLKRGFCVAAGVLGASLSLTTMNYAQGAPVLLKRDKQEISQQENSEKDKIEKATGKISGTVTDPAGAVIVGTSVQIKGNGFSSTVNTDAEGRYEFQNLSPGEYTIEFSATGFESKTIQINVLAEEETKTDVSLDVSSKVALMGVVAIVEYDGPLFNAVLNDDLQEVQNLIATGANVNQRDKKNGRITPLFLAVENGNSRIAETLLMFGAKVNARDEEKRTPLMSLDDDATPELVRLLLSYGANADLVDKQGNNALILAAGFVRTEVLQILISHTTNLNLQNKEGRTALMEAAEADNLENVRALLAAGADVNLKDKEGDTAWDLTTSEEIETLLESYGAKTDEN